MKSKIRCLLLDDDIHSLEYLRLLCSQIPQVEIVKCFTDPAQLLNMQATLEFDICLLDIDMPTLNGLQVAELLQGKGVIFTTAHSQYAADAFDLNAIDFIRKPIQKSRLQQAIDKALEGLQSLNEKQEFHSFNTDKGKMLIKLDEILCITTSKAEKRDKEVYLQNDQVLTLKNITLEKLLSILPSNFYQVNKSDIVSLQAVHFMQHDELALKIKSPDGKPLVLTLSPTYRGAFLKATQR